MTRLRVKPKPAAARRRAKPAAFTLYPKNASRALDPKLFANPSSEYRGTPFWSWNTKLDVTQLLRQIDHLRRMGFGGFHIHARTGLETPYLGEEFMSDVRACAEKAKADSLLCWLYDEDRWPSGFAGGLVTADPRFRARHLLWTTKPYSGQVVEACQDERAAGTRSENGTLLATYEVTLTDDGRLASYRRLALGAKPRSRNARLWYAYLEIAQPSSWFNHQTYVDTMNPAAIRRFTEVTHDRYARTVGDLFGSVVPAIFTDEPQFPKKTTFQRGADTRDVILPFTDDFPDTYRAAYHQDLLDHLPELFWNLPGDAPSLPRYCYHDHTAERFAGAFGDTLAQWCAAHNIALTGHMLGEAVLYGQTRAVGECMRALRSFQLPGIDILCDKMELTTAKQAQSIARQYARPGVTSELYGVTNWDFDFPGHKRQGDWQAALGVTVRVPHLAWVSMRGESKRDYPAAIGHQSPWFEEYALVEDHFARLNTVLTRGQPLVRVAVIHPVESFWLAWGPVEHNAAEWERREAAFKDITAWLLFGLVDFDYLCESLLPSQNAKVRGKRLHVGAMAYDAVVVPDLRTIRKTTLDRLEAFAKAGGTVIFAGDVPTLVDAKPSPAPSRLAKRATRVPWSRTAILDSLAPFREIAVTHADGAPADSLLHQFRTDGKDRHLFLCNTDRDRSRNDVRVTLNGTWSVTALDTRTGGRSPKPAVVSPGTTELTLDLPAHGHALLTLTPTTKRVATISVQPRPRWTEVARLADPVPVTLSEPNILLLDQAEWRLDDTGDWQPVEELLRLENKVRDQLRLPHRGGRDAQPWTDTSPAPVLAHLYLRFTIHSDIAVDRASLALEDAEAVRIRLNDTPVPNTPTGTWVDDAIQTVALPSLARGTHTLTFTLPFTRKTNVEWCYLLGDFGVHAAGRHARIVAPVRELSFGDWTQQGLPFYAGNVTYHCTLTGAGKPTLVEFPHFKSPLLSASLDDQPPRKLPFAPFELDLGPLAGEHRLAVTVYGNRVNTFGALHNANEKLTWFGPGAWRQTGSSWSYEYQFRRMGLLTAPIVKVSTPYP